MVGFVKLHRGWEDSDIFPNEPYCARAAWCWLVSNAAWKEIIRHGGKGDEFILQPGQIHVSDRSLASVWGWDKKRVRRFLAKLERAKSATSKRTTSGTIVTIENWGKYQSQGPTEGPTEGPTKDQPRTTQEERKEGKEEKEPAGAAFAFFGRTVRLNDRDFAQWQRVFSGIPDLAAELHAIDLWWQEQDEPAPKNWFYRTSQMLNRKHQEARRKADDDPMEGFIC